MKILVAWDDPDEADLLQLYLNTGDNEATVVLSAADYLAQLQRRHWTVILLAVSFSQAPTDVFGLFQQTQQLLPTVPVVLACRTTEMLHLPHFIRHGLTSYVIRDNSRDFVFLVLSSLESALATKHAEEARKLAEKLREEMESVRRLQETIIPRGLQAPPGYRLAARYEPSQVRIVGERPVVMAGGDYYDVFRPDELTLILLIGDASGHGLKACMSIMSMHTLVRMIRGHSYHDTARFVGEINQRLCNNSVVQTDGGFITLFYAALDTTEHTMTWTSAGHPLGLLHLLDSNEVVQVGDEAENGLPLAVAPNLEYGAGKVALPPNSRLLLYSDGLTDAFAPDRPGHDAFGVPGLIESLKASRAVDLDQALEHLFQASSAFTKGAGRHDDTSVVLLERLK